MLATPMTYRDPPPLFGQHADEVLDILLGIDANGRQALRAVGAIG